MMSDSGAPPDNSAAETLLDPRESLLENNADGEATARLLAIYKVGQVLLEKRDPDEVAETIQSAVVEHLGTDFSCMLRVGRDGNHEIVSKQDGDDQKPWTVSQTILDRVIETRCSALVTDTHHDPTVTDATSIKNMRIRSVMCVPIGTAPIRGMIYADRRGRRRLFQRGDLEFLTALALYAHLALDLTEDYRLTERALELAHRELLTHEMIGRSRELWKAFDQVTRLAKAGKRVLLRGETGVGKELFARAYYKNSARNGKPFVKVAVPALSASLVESELFGHVRGAFTGAMKDHRGWLEHADGGVLFLDEVADIDRAIQPKLLRFLDGDNGEYQRVGDTRTRFVDSLVVSATSQPIETWVEEDRFREDLFARLGLVITIPPLRERPGDIPLLVRHYLDRCGEAGKKKAISDEAMTMLANHSWPGNIRRLQQLAEYVVFLVDEDVIRPEHLPAHFHSDESPVSGGPHADDEQSIHRLRRVVQEVEVDYVRRALRVTGNNKSLAIKQLDISKDKFYKVLERAGLHKYGDKDSDA